MHRGTLLHCTVAVSQLAFVIPSAHNSRSSADSRFHGLTATADTVVVGLKGKKTSQGFLTHFMASNMSLALL